MQYLGEQGAKESTLKTAEYRLVGLLRPVQALPVRDLTTARCASLYRTYAATRRPDTHQGALALAKAMGDWWKKHKLVGVNPWAEVEPTGKKSHGKPQLRIDEARKLAIWALSQPAHEDGPCAVLVALLLGLRASEVVGIDSRDVDDNGRVLWVAKSKTKAGVRPLVVPEVLRPCLARRAKGGLLFPYNRRWVLDQTKRACRAAGVPVVSAHGLRGTHATLALEAGASPTMVADSIGHESIGTTLQSYAAKGSGRSAQVERVGERIGVNVSRDENGSDDEP